MNESYHGIQGVITGSCRGGLFLVGFNFLHRREELGMDHINGQVPQCM